MQVGQDVTTSVTKQPPPRTQAQPHRDNIPYGLK
jgi:hypothetical protein